jgi:signal transduction histidine kinase
VRRELTTAFAAMAALITLAFVIPLALSARLTARDRALDAGRAQTASLVPLVAAGQLGSLDSAVASINARGRNQVTVVVNGQVVGPPLVANRRLDAALATAASSTGTADGGFELVTAVAGPGATSAVRVLVPDRELGRGLFAAWSVLAGTAVVLVLVSVAVADRIAQGVVRPAQRLADAAHRLGQGDLEVVVEPSGPDELVETADAFNRLSGQVRTMLAAEREMVSELTHRLRTPLTRLRIDLDQVNDTELATELHRDVDALTAEVNDLIAQARRAADPPAPVDVNLLVTERYEFWSALATDEDRPCHLYPAPGPVPVAVEADSLTAALDVLLENVFAHTERGTAFAVSVTPNPGGCAITVEDSGPGFDPALVEAGRSGRGSAGTGLGLAIVERLARATGGRLEIATSPLGGARVSCRLGPTGP